LEVEGLMKEQFIDWRPSGASAEIVNAAEAICRDYYGQGYNLTLRQLYYQFVARGLIANTTQSYKRLGSIVDSARLAGLLDWSYIEDRTRNVYRTDGADESPEEAIAATAGGYARALWNDQPNHVEVWVEKEALAGVIQRAANEVGVNYFACRGYVSQSEMYSSGKRFRLLSQRGKKCTILHLGDHDPSGIDMTRDIETRLSMFSGYLDEPDVRRIALNMDQIEELNPPPNPAKQTDSRFAAYLEEYGDESWELDALDPTTLHDLIVNEVRGLRDEDLWTEAVARQERERRQLTAVSDRWAEVIDLVDDGGFDD
jgi:hypothetical protein